MKVQKFLFATILCGVFGIFAACSDDVNPVTGEIDTTDPVAEEVETVLTFSAGVSNGNISTRSATDEEGEKVEFDKNVNTAQKLVVALFNVEIVKGKDQPSRLIALNVFDKLELNKWTDDSYNLPAIKFKITPTIKNNKKSYAKVAMVVLGNCDLFDKSAKKEETIIADFKEFKKYTDLKANVNHGVNYLAKDGSLAPIYGSPYNLYEMSSNVHIFEVQAGAINSIGIDETAAKEIVAVDGDISFNEIQKDPIYLYRIAAEVELYSLTFEDYSADQTFDHFVLEEVFIMNAPMSVNWFDAEASVSDWGGKLNISFDEYLKNGGKFSTGNKNGFNNGGSGDITPVAGLYCNDKILNNREHKIVLDFSNTGDDNMRGKKYTKYTDPAFNSNGYYGSFYEKRKFKMRKEYIAEKASTSNYPQIKFAVAPSNYGKEGTDKALCLVVKGRYYYKTGGVVIGSDENLNVNPYASKYYTVVVNKKGEAQIDGAVPLHNDEVLRNVRYQISLTISGPGSDTPWDYTENSYVVPKVRIVPFGVVEQESKFD